MKFLFVAVLAVAFFTPATPSLVGRWESIPSEKGNVTAVLFRSDSTFEGYVNKKPFVSGVYSFSEKDSIFRMTDNGCSGFTGIYKIHFYSNSDSLRMTAIDEPCEERRQGVEKLVMGRVKQKAK